MSGGEQQMVAIGRAMMSNPSILALDEPSLGLSPLLCKDLFESLRVVKQAGLGILLVEQNAKQSLRIADRGYLLENGNIVHEDDAERLANDPAVQKAYLGGSGAATGARRPAPATRSTPAVPRPATGPKPNEIAAAAMKSVGAPARPVPVTKPTAPAPKPAPAANGTAAVQKLDTPNTSDLVAKASATASRRNGATPPPRAPTTQPAPTQPTHSAQPAIPDFASSSDRLRSMIEDIEAAARRAETYKPRR